MKRLITILCLAVTLKYSHAQSPGGVSSGLQIWLKGDAGTSSTTNGAALSYWNDASGNARNATQSIVASRPSYVSNGINGYGTVRTASSKYFDINLSVIDNHSFTVFAVTKRESTAASQYFMGVQQSTPYPGLHIGYSGISQLRFNEYNSRVNVTIPSYTAATSIHAVTMQEFSTTTGKLSMFIQDGVVYSRTNPTTTSYLQNAQGNIGRGSAANGFIGQIAEVIIYNRVLTAAEKKQIQTYLCIKYGVGINYADNIYYNESAYGNDIFGIGKSVAQGLNQTVSNSINTDDILELRDPTSLDDGDYLVCGNQNGAKTFAAYSGTNCTISSLMSRVWKAKRTGDIGTVTMKFDMTGITGFTSANLMIIVDTDGDGFDDETGYVGTYTAPYFEVSGVDIPNGAKFTIAQGNHTWYAVASGNTSGAIWSLSPTGTPVVMTSACTNYNLTINSGVTVTNNLTSLVGHNFTVKSGAIFNAGTGTLTLAGDFTMEGNFNAQTSTVIFQGNKAQNFKGSSIVNIYNLTINNIKGVTIATTVSGVQVRNYVLITSGAFTTNAKLTLISDASATGMIGPLTSGSIIGNITQQRYHNALAQGWINLCSPISGKTIADWNDDIITTGFAGADYPPPYPFNNVQYYNESVAGGMNAGFVGVTNMTNSIVNGRGYFVFMNAGAVNIDVDGTIISGNQSLPVTYTNTGNAAGDGWNLVANPYPCTIDWNATGWTKTNIQNAVYVWNAAIGQYASYVGGTGTNGGSRYVPSSQSFLVRSTAASPVLTVTESCKTNTQAAFKSAESIGSLSLRIENGFYSDEISLINNEFGTLNFNEALDAYKLRSPLEEVPYMASISTDGDDLSINAFALDQGEMTIPIRIEVGQSGTYTLSHNGLGKFANGACISLEDSQTGIIYPLNQVSEISLQLNAGEADIRFILHIGGAAIGNITSSGCPGLSEGKVLITASDDLAHNIAWMDESGEIMQTGVVHNNGLEISGLDAGYYFLSIDNNGVCGTTTTEVFVQADEPVMAEGSVEGASCPDSKDGSISLTIYGGTGEYDVQWNTGAKSTELEALGGGEYVAFVTDGNGCSNSFNFTVPVKNTLISSFETTDETFELKNGAVAVDFYNTSESAIDYVWMFNDGTMNSEESNPTHVYNARGIYQVVLIAKDENCESNSTKTIRIVEPKDEGNSLSPDIMAVLTDNGVQIRFFLNEPRQLKISAYTILGQQLIVPFTDIYTRETITFSDRRYAANSLIEIVDTQTGERAIFKLGR
jgi:PKD domain